MPVVAVAIVVVVLLFVAFAVTGTDLPDPDIWWNLAEGLVRMHTGSEPSPVLFGAHGCPDEQRAVSHAAVALYAHAWSALGMWGLVVARTLLVATVALAVVASISPAARLSLVERAAWASCIAAALSLRATPRPELVGLALFAIACALVARFVFARRDAARVVRNPRSWMFAGALVVVHALAVWSHATFMFIPLVCCAAVVGTAIARDVVGVRRSLVALGACALGFLARPAAVFGFAHASDERAVAHALGFREWQSPVVAFFDGWRPPGLGALLLVVLASVLGVAWCLRFERASADRTPVARALTALFVLVPLFALGLDATRAVVLCACAAPLHLGLVAHIPARARRGLAVAAGGGALLVALSTMSVDPWLTLRVEPSAFAPSRLAPIGPGAFLDAHPERRGLVYAPLHASNWLLFSAVREPLSSPTADVRVVWSGRRTYTRECGAELIAGRRGGDAFDRIDGRLHPDLVLAMHATEVPLVETLAARGFTLVYIDLRYALFARPSSARTVSASLTIDPAALESAETRPFDDATFRALLTSTCRTLQVAASAHAGPTCAAVRRLPEAPTLSP